MNTSNNWNCGNIPATLPFSGLCRELRDQPTSGQIPRSQYGHREPERAIEVQRLLVRRFHPMSFKIVWSICWLTCRFGRRSVKDVTFGNVCRGRVSIGVDADWNCSCCITVDEQQLFLFNIQGKETSICKLRHIVLADSAWFCLTAAIRSVRHHPRFLVINFLLESHSFIVSHGHRISQPGLATFNQSSSSMVWNQL